MSDDSDFETPADLDVTTVDTDGKTFDVNAGKTWIYPINFPIRDYQFNIIKNALFYNTLVSLPTGLGKTFVAAVVMYNFYRWYPLGKILFLAPTRPLVKQQMDACYNITAIPKSTTVELTGNIERNSKEVLWKNKRVFFITPQVLQNDLDTVKCLGANIRCIVFDEAHKARGNHAYAEVMKKLIKLNDFFRVLALSATPGKDANDIAMVIQNLLISHLEFRTEESSDVQKYVFQRTIETLVVPLDHKMLEVKNAYLNILESYTRHLMKYKIIQGNCNTLTKGKIFMTLKDFQTKNNINRHPNYSEILRNLNVCVTLYHAYELLIRHGLRSFVYYFTEHLDKPLLRGNMALKEIVQSTERYLNSAEQLDNTCVKGHVKVGHPKFLKLREILLTHFTKTQEQSHVIVFFEYRESTKEAYSILLKDEPLIRSRIFLGQSSGMSQKEQFSVIKAFKEGKCNTLLSTCIGEEGLDVGEVDLIICFDISNRSPIRMIQRMGRTGRKRNGHIIVLVTQGKKQQTLEECLQHKKCLPADISTLSHVKNVLYTKCPRMIPDDILPQCEKVYFTVKKSAAQSKKLTIVDIFQSKYNHSQENINEINDGITLQLPSQNENLWNKSNPLESESHSNIICNNLDALRRLQFYSEIGHSATSQVLVSLLQFADRSRFNIALTSWSPQKKRLVQGDIRDIFKQSQNINSDCNKSPTASFSSNNDQQDTLLDSISDETYSEIAQFLKTRATLQGTGNLFQPPRKYSKIPVLNNINLDTWVQPNMSILLKYSKHDFLQLMESENEFQVECNATNIADDKACTQKSPANNINDFKQRSIIDILNFFKLSNLQDIFAISKCDMTKPEENDNIANTTIFSPKLTMSMECNPTLQIKYDKNNICYPQSKFNSNEGITSYELSQDIVCELNDFVDIGDIFDTTNMLTRKHAVAISEGSKDSFQINSKHKSVDQGELSRTKYIHNEDSCKFPHTEILGGNNRKRKKCTSNELSFTIETDSTNLQLVDEVNMVTDRNMSGKRKKSYIAHKNPLSVCKKYRIDSSPKEESQMSITQILSFVNKEEASIEQNHDNSNQLSNINFEHKDHFKDLLDYMV